MQDLQKSMFGKYTSAIDKKLQYLSNDFKETVNGLLKMRSDCFKSMIKLEDFNTSHVDSSEFRTPSKSNSVHPYKLWGVQKRQLTVTPADLV